jgi:RecA/RadA recombinase
MLVQTGSPQTRVSLNIRNVDELFPGFETGEFTVLHGSESVLPLSLLLCVRAQLPVQLGGLGANVVFVDGGNTFQLYQVTHLAQLHQLNPRSVLERIYISRAFTAYQMTSLTMGKMEEAAKRTGAKLVIISDIGGLFLDKDIPDEEARRVFSQVTAYLSTFAQKNHLALVATYFPRKASRRNFYLNTLTCGRASVVASLKQSRHGRRFVLEKHPRLVLGYAEFPSENLTLKDFMESS